MIEIRQKTIGKVLLIVPVDTLIGADLRGADLNGADLSGVDLSGADLSGADLSGADLSDADLSDALLIGTDLSDANLMITTLISSNLTNANLNRVRLNGADLSFAILTNAHLREADLSGAQLSSTQFLLCDNLHQAKGLESIMHFGPSSLDASTLRASVEYLPDIFLRGIGYTDEEIDNFRGSYGRAFRFYSCFISYVRSNDDFVNRLFSDLQTSGVTCWKDTENMRGGDYYQSQITQAINVHDKVILICSRESLKSPTVISKILEAKELLDTSGVHKLFPIRLDDFIFSEELKEIGKKETAEGNWPQNWLARLNAFYIPDFSGWKDHDAYQKAFQKLLKDLKADAKAI